MDNASAARVLDDIAALLEACGEDPYRARAYAKAARSIRDLRESVAELAAAGRLRQIPGVGRAIADKLSELVATGRLAYYEELRAGFPPGSRETLAGIEGLRGRRGRFLPKVALREAAALEAVLREVPGVERLALGGSLRRNRELVGDIDLVCATRDPGAVLERLAALPQVRSVLETGPRRSVVRLDSGIEADVQAVGRAEFPFTLLRTTGSKEHWAALVARAAGLGLGLDDRRLLGGGRRVACRDEAAIYAALGLDEIPPELRENLGEIEAAAEGRLPRLVAAGDLRGVIHLHSTYSDGADTLEAMVRAAAELGYEYVGITDHSKSAFYAHGLAEREVERQHREIDGLARRYPGIRILKGIESDILADGALDYAPQVLAAFDFVIASVHSRFKMDARAMTARIVRALENPYTAILGHPTGRRLLEREGYAVDLERVLDAARANGVAVELNAHPERLDLDWRFVRRAVDRGVVLAVVPDAHGTAGLADVAYGVGLARKGWLPPEQVLNARPVEAFLAFSQARRSRVA